MKIVPFRVAISITGTTLTLDVKMVDSEGPMAGAVLAGAVSAAAYNCDAFWAAVEMTRPPMQCNEKSIHLNRSTTQRAAAFSFVTLLPHKTTLGFSIFTAGRDTPLQAGEPVPFGPDIPLPLVLFEKLHPEFEDAIQQLCEMYMRPVLQAKVDFVNAQAEDKKRKREQKKRAKGTDVHDGLTDITATQQKIKELKEKANAKSTRAFVTPLVNPMVVKHAVTHGVAHTIESIRRLFLFFLRQSIYEAEKHYEQCNDARQAALDFCQEVHGRYSHEIYFRYFGLIKHGRVPHEDHACYNDYVKHTQLVAELNALKLTAVSANELLKETFKWTVCHDVDCRDLYVTHSDTSDGQLKTIVSAIMYTCDQQQLQLKTQRQLQMRAEQEVAKAELKRKRDEVAVEKIQKRAAREATQLASAGTAAAKYRSGGASSLNQPEMRALAHVAFSTKLTGKKREMADQFDAAAAAASGAAWLENVCKRAKKD
jgi:hypothetical protein